MNTPAARATLLILLGTIFHLLYSTHLELVGDEAYYWLWSRHPDICYLDKGPMIAWLVAASTSLFSQSVFAIRLPAVLCASGTSVCLFLLGRRMFSDRVGYYAVALGFAAPLFAVGATLMTIDTVYILFWSWAALQFWKAKDSTRILPWVWTGVLVGCGLLSKYTAALELVCFALFCIYHRPARLHFLRPTFWSMVLVAGCFLLPAIVWNHAHGWPTLVWLWQRGDMAHGFSFRPLFAIRFLWEQAAVISPLLFIGILIAALGLITQRRRQAAYLFAGVLFFVPFLIYLAESFHYAEPPNWAAAAYIGGFLLVTAQVFDPLEAKWKRAAFGVAIGMAVLQTSLLLETRWLHLSHRNDPLDRARGSRNLAQIVEQWRVRSSADFVVADNYMTASLLSFYLPNHREVGVPPADYPLNQLEVWRLTQKMPTDKAALIVCKRKGLSEALREYFQCVELARFELNDGDRVLGSYAIFLGRVRPGKAATLAAPP